eukprot:8308567-Pyramimonas_sp.AAC.1
MLASGGSGLIPASGPLMGSILAPSARPSMRRSLISWALKGNLGASAHWDLYMISSCGSTRPTGMPGHQLFFLRSNGDVVELTSVAPVLVG